MKCSTLYSEGGAGGGGDEFQSLLPTLLAFWSRSVCEVMYRATRWECSPLINAPLSPKNRISVKQFHDAQCWKIDSIFNSLFCDSVHNRWNHRDLVVGGHCWWLCYWSVGSKPSRPHTHTHTLTSVNLHVPVACHVTVFHSGCPFMHVITNRPVGPLRHSAFLPRLRLHFLPPSSLHSHHVSEPFFLFPSFSCFPTSSYLCFFFLTSYVFCCS